MAGIWVFAEGRDQTLELINAGKKLAGELGTQLVALATKQQFAQDYIDHGADEVLLLPLLAEGQPVESYVAVIAEAAREGDPDVFFLGGTPRGKEMAARLAVRLETGLCSGCTGFALADGGTQLQMERMAYGGAAVQTVVCTTRPQMATIPPRTFEPAAPEAGRTGKITELGAAPSTTVKVVSRAPRSKETVDITEARVVVCVGRGMGKKEDLGLAQQLAELMEGEVACSRPVAEDLQWLPEELYLGISGKKVKPDLYVGLGVSGQIQHVSGIRDSKVIFAINRDENAPIFEAADYGIVGDLYQVVPQLIEALKTARK